MKQLWCSFKDHELKLEFRKGEAKAWNSFVSLWEEFVGIFLCILLFVVGEEDPIGFLGFCAGTFIVLQTLLSEVFSIVLF